MENAPLKTLEEVSGIPKKKLLDIWAEVKENRKRLESCPGPHDFSVDKEPNRHISKKWECSKCGGVIDGVAKFWYEQGLRHHKEGPGQPITL